MNAMEQNIKNYFASWLAKDASVLSQVFAEDAVYYESYGPAYQGLGEIRRWFDDWNRRGTVLKWDIYETIQQGDALICKWYFECDCEGTVGGFDGVSWVLYDYEGKIRELREYAAKLPYVFPYSKQAEEPLLFRRAGSSDLLKINSMFQSALNHLREQGIDQWDEVYPDSDVLAQDIAEHSMYVVLREDAIISAVTLNEEQPPEYETVGWRIQGGKIAVIHRLCVNAEEQGKGYGKHTVLLAEQELRKQGFSRIRLDAFTLNSYSNRLYETLGYQKAGTVQFRKGAFYCYEKSL